VLANNWVHCTACYNQLPSSGAHSMHSNAVGCAQHVTPVVCMVVRCPRRFLMYGISRSCSWQLVKKHICCVLVHAMSEALSVVSSLQFNDRHHWQHNMQIKYCWQQRAALPGIKPVYTSSSHITTAVLHHTGVAYNGGDAAP
jgi:hypothetical protein